MLYGSKRLLVHLLAVGVAICAMSNPSSCFFLELLTLARVTEPGTCVAEMHLTPARCRSSRRAFFSLGSPALSGVWGIVGNKIYNVYKHKGRVCVWSVQTASVCEFFSQSTVFWFIFLSHRAPARRGLACHLLELNT